VSAPAIAPAALAPAALELNGRVRTLAVRACRTLTFNPCEVRVPVYVSLPTRCECGALVRMVGPCEVRGAWLCPLCGCAYPYAFWKMPTPRGDAGRPRELTDAELAGGLIVRLADDACSACHESRRAWCRCRRVAEHEAHAEGLDRYYAERAARFGPGCLPGRTTSPDWTPGPHTTRALELYEAGGR
jgi:hypothetical protein